MENPTKAIGRDKLDDDYINSEICEGKDYFENKGNIYW
jgi:hypothetical protein